MTAVRAVLVALTILVLAIAPMVVPGVTGSPGDQAAYAAPADSPLLQNDNDDNGNDNDDGDDNGNDNDDGDDNGNDNDDDGDIANDGIANINGNDNGDDDDNGNDNGDDNGNDNDDDGDDNDNEDVPDPILVPEPGGVDGGGIGQTGGTGGSTSCTIAGQESVFSSDDGRVAVRVFGNQGGIRMSIDGPVALDSVPAAPGPRVDAFVYRINADRCDDTPIQMLDAEVNLGVHYTDADIASLNEANFRLALLDPASDEWEDFDKQAPDPGANYISATIMEVGYITIYQRP